MDQNHHRHHHHHDRSSPFDFDVGSSQIPPRRSLLDRRGAKLSSGTFDDAVKSQPSDSFWFSLHKFLLCNNEEECCWPAVDSFSCDEFRMYEFKVRRCMRGRSHDWTECPFAHPGEKARRRDPRRFHYSCTVCPDFRRGSCRRGDACEFAHGVFECWLHPARYRTQPCKDGRNCKRKVCFFAHTPQQLRVLPSNVQQDCSETLPCNGFYLRYPSENPDSTILNRRCSVCFPRSNHLPFLCKASPVPAISTQRGYSHPNPSPPPSPSPLSPGSSNNNGNVNNNNKDCSCTGGYPPICSYQTTIPGNTRNILPAGVGYQNLLAMLVNSLEAIDVASINKNRGWGSFESDQQSSLPFPPLFSPDSVLCNVDEPEVPQQAQGDRVSNSVFSSDIHGPDLEWVDELVM